jgi:hypothetical protein
MNTTRRRSGARSERSVTTKLFPEWKKPAVPEVVPPKELHEARIIRDAEVADPGIVRRANPRPRTSSPAPARGGTSAGPNPSRTAAIS